MSVNLSDKLGVPINRHVDDTATSIMDNTNHALQVNVVAGGGAGGTSSTFGASFPGIGTAAGAKDISGNMAALNLDGSGNLKIAGSLTVNPTQSNTATAITSPFTVGTLSIQAIAANASRKRLTLQCVGTTVIYVLFGASTASSSNYHIALAANGTSNDGSSRIWTDTMWTGAVQVISSASGGSLSIMENT
jgi:hypothetical protein